MPIKHKGDEILTIVMHKGSSKVRLAWWDLIPKIEQICYAKWGDCTSNALSVQKSLCIN